MNKFLGLPYMGSKRKIAFDILEDLKLYKPQAKYFYDLFGGGGAMSFAALQLGYKVLYNEFDTDLANFMQYIQDRIANKEHSKFGLFPEEWYAFVTREEFVKQRELHTPYAEFCRIVYSFGNNRRDYLFNSEIEKWKHLAHNVVVYQDEKALKEFNKIVGIDAEMCVGNTINERRLDFKAKTFTKFNRLDLKQLQRLEQLQRLQRLERLQQLEQLQRLQQLEISNKSYDEVIIPYNDDEVIIYCDSPYRGTQSYKDCCFDFDKFDEWLKNHDKTIFMSEYNMPFKELHSRVKRSTLSSTANNLVYEKLYCNKDIQKLGQMRLF